MAEERQDQYGGCLSNAGSKITVPSDINQLTTNQDLGHKSFQLATEEGLRGLTDRVIPAVPQVVAGHYMHNVKNDGSFAGAQIGQVNIQINGPRAEQKVEEETMERGKRESGRYQEMCKVSERALRTTLYHAVLRMLDNMDSVTVLGNAGDGKTTLLHLACLEYSTRGYLTVEINRPEDITKYDIRDRSVLFVCDSFLGRILIDHKKKTSWINYNRDKLTSDKVKLLFACRLELWREHELYLHQNPMFQDTVDVRSYKLTTQDKMEMINQHLGDKISYDTKSRIARASSFAFPECCRFVSQTLDVIDFTNTRKLVEIFTNPFQFVVNQLKSIGKNNKLQYATLVLCLLNGRKLPKTGTSKVLQQTNVEEVKRRYLSDKTVEQVYDTLLDKAEELDGWLLTQDGDNYVFYHDSVHEAMCRVHGARYPEDILGFCKPNLVFSLFTTKEVSALESDRMALRPGSYPQLVKILTGECVKGTDWYDSEIWRFVFKEMQTADVLKEWSMSLMGKMSLIKKMFQNVFSRTHTEPKLADVLLLITKLPDSHLTVDRVFEGAAYHGDVRRQRHLLTMA